MLAFPCVRIQSWFPSDPREAGGSECNTPSSDVVILAAFPISVNTW